MPRAAASKGNVHVALLRGINLGGRNRLPMRELAALFEKAGCSDVRTYIQSGNVLFRASGARAARIPASIAEAIAGEFGFRVPVVTRTAAELAAVALKHPFLAAGAAPETLHVLFLAEPPPRARVASLDPARSPPDAFAVVGRDVYLHLPRGVARTKLTNDYFDRALATTSTMRNLRTVLKLVDMSAPERAPAPKRR